MKISFTLLIVIATISCAGVNLKINNYPVSHSIIGELSLLKKQMMDFDSNTRKEIINNANYIQRLQSRYTLANLESDVANLHTIIVALQIESSHGERGQVHEDIIYVLDKMIAGELSLRENIISDMEKDEKYDFDSSVSGLPAKHYAEILSFRQKTVSLLKQARDEINMTMNIVGKTN